VEQLPRIAGVFVLIALYEQQGEAGDGQEHQLDR
jgi:hypothetical protein